MVFGSKFFFNTSRKFILVVIIAVILQSCAPEEKSRCNYFGYGHPDGISVNGIKLSHASTYFTGDGSMPEISAYDPDSKLLFSITHDKKILVIDISDTLSPKKKSEINISGFGGGVNSVAVANGIVAAAIENEDKSQNGKVIFLGTDGNAISSVEVGALPDMLAFTPDCNKVIVANEGEPSADYAVNREGSISLIDITHGVKNAVVSSFGFSSFNNGRLDQSIRANGNPEPSKTSVAQDLEPEYIAVDLDSKKAYASLQENNAIAVIDLVQNKIISIHGLGFKSHTLIENRMDASDSDLDGKKGMANIRAWPVLGIYQPDGIVSYKVNGVDYLITANEGDDREFPEYRNGSGWKEAVKIKDLEGIGAGMDPNVFPDSEELSEKMNIGNLRIARTLGDEDGDGDYDKLYSFGARSFSVWGYKNGKLSQVFDSGGQIEQKIAELYPDYFNFDGSNFDEENHTTFDATSPKKGPEPEGITLGYIGNKIFAFIGLEKFGGVMVYDATNPEKPEFVQYVTERDFSAKNILDSKSLRPEGILFIPSYAGPNGKNLLVVSNEGSGSINIYEIEVW